MLNALVVLLVSVPLLTTKTPYPTYFEGARFIHFLIGPATVALVTRSETAGAFSALAMGLNGVATAILAPLAVKLMRVG